MIKRDKENKIESCELWLESNYPDISIKLLFYKGELTIEEPELTYLKEKIKDIECISLYYRVPDSTPEDLEQLKPIVLNAILDNGLMKIRHCTYNRDMYNEYLKRNGY